MITPFSTVLGCRVTYSIQYNTLTIFHANACAEHSSGSLQYFVPNHCLIDALPTAQAQIVLYLYDETYALYYTLELSLGNGNVM